MDFKAWVEAHNGDRPSQVLSHKTKEQKASATPEQQEEHGHAEWLHRMKAARQGKSTKKLYDKVDSILTELFGAQWHLTNNKPGPRKKVAPQQAFSSRLSAPRALTDIEKYHQTFKRMKSATFVKRVQQNRQEWHEYHRTADEHDQRDPEERRPVHKIAKALADVKPGKRAIDLGCGKNLLRTLAPHLRWTSVDAVAADDTVVEADIAALPHEDEEFSIAVLSRALWATNKDDVIREAMRVLVDGGQLIVCEAFRKWWDAHKNENTLVNLLRSSGCVVERTYGASPADGDEVFQYIVCRKPMHVVSM